MTPEAERLGLELFEESRIDAALDQGVRDLLCHCFPPDVEVFSKERCWNGVRPAFTLVCRENHVVKGHVGVVVREVDVEGRRVTAAGIQSLAVSEDMRGTGAGRALMVEAMDGARRRGVQFGLLFCVPALEKYYAALGWETRDATVYRLDAQGRRTTIPGKNIVMTLDLAGEPFPGGDIDLLGRDW